MITIISIILPYIVIFFLLFDRYKDERYKNFVKSFMSKDIQEFTESVDEPDETPLPEEDDLIDLTEVPSDILIKALENENKQSEN